MKKPVFKLLAVAALAMSAFGANAADSSVTGDPLFLIMGNGNANRGFTIGTDANNTIEVGLRAKLRYPNPSDNTAGIDSNNNGTYNQGAGNHGGSALWNFDWSINVDRDLSSGEFLSDYTYMLTMDFDPSWGVNGTPFNPINANAAACWDHSFGNSGTAGNAGAEVNCTTSAGTYGGVLAANSLVQQSWNFEWFDFGSTFDPNAAGNYNIKLEVFDGTNRLAFSSIDVIVGGGYVPEPGSLALVGVALGGLAFARKRKATK